jgi:hypothetical protein
MTTTQFKKGDIVWWDDPNPAWYDPSEGRITSIRGSWAYVRFFHHGGACDLHISRLHHEKPEIREGQEDLSGRFLGRRSQ